MSARNGDTVTPRAVFEVLFDLQLARKRHREATSYGAQAVHEEAIVRLERELIVARAAGRGCGQ